MIRRRRKASSDGLSQLVVETRELVAKLVKENRDLKSRNLRLSRDLDRITAGWEEIKRLTRSSPRRRR